MEEQRLIRDRDQLLQTARQHFESNPDVVGLFVAGSLAAGCQDAYSDIDLRVVVTPDKHRWFVENRRDIPRGWPGFLFNEWRPGTLHCVSHFRCFVKIDIFYFSEDELQPSPWHALPLKVLLDRNGSIDRMIRASRHLDFEVSDDDLDCSISKGLAALHEVFRRTRRGELVFAQTLLEELRFHVIQADHWLAGRNPRAQLFSKFDHCGTAEVVQCLHFSYCCCDAKAIHRALMMLGQLYRHHIEQLHEKFRLARPVDSDLIAINLVLDELVTAE